MSNMENLMGLIASGTLNAKAVAINSVSDLQARAKKFGVPVTREEIADFIKAQQSNEAAGNIAGVDGNGALIFGRDWYYTPPHIEARSIL